MSPRQYLIESLSEEESDLHRVEQEIADLESRLQDLRDDQIWHQERINQINHKLRRAS